MQKVYETPKDYKLARLEQVLLNQILTVNETAKKIAFTIKEADEICEEANKNEKDFNKIKNNAESIKQDLSTQLIKIKNIIELNLLLGIEMALIDRDEKALKDSLSSLKSMNNSLAKSDDVKNNLLEIKKAAPQASDSINQAILDELVKTIDEILKI